MRKPFRIASATLPLLLALGAPGLPALAPDKSPPHTKADAVSETLHGVEVTDPYRWLEDQKSPETRAWIEAQNRYAESILGGLPGREALATRLGELLRVEVTGVPEVAHGRYFFTKRRAGQDLSVLCVRKGSKGRDEVLVDPHPLSPDHTTSVGILDVSDDGRTIAYFVREGGEDELVVRLLDVDTKKELPDVLPKARYSGVAFSRDRKSLLYSRRLEEGPRVFEHALGSDPASDRKIFGDGYGPEKIISVDVAGGRYLVAVVFHGSAAKRTEVYFQDLASGGPMRPIVNDIEARFFPAIGGERMYLRTDWKAPRGRILAVDLKDPSREKWREVVPEGKGSLQGLTTAAGRLLVEVLENVVPRLRVFDDGGRLQREITFPAPGSVGSVEGRWEANEAFFQFASFVVPPTIYRYDAAKGERTVWSRQSSPIESQRFVVEQVRYSSKDGTEIPMFLVHAKGLKRDGKNPTLLTGYGGFSVPQTPAFSARAAAWVERGGVFALPNLRGGGEFGEQWHHAGMLEKKQNVFDDFLAAAQWLVAQKYTSPEHLAISGGSNGGLLVGAAMTQRPELFSAVVCSYPLLDMVRYHKFLVAGYWVPEYGSAEDSRQFRYIREYSPYQNVREGAKYPSVLFITGDSDTRVDPLHARKMAALLQAASGSDPAEEPVVLRYDTKAGHSRAATPVTKQIAELVDELSFLMWQTGPAAGVAGHERSGR